MAKQHSSDYSNSDYAARRAEIDTPVFRAEKAADKLAQQVASLDHQDRVEAMTEFLGCLVEYLGVRQTTSLMQEASQRLAAEWAEEEKVAAELAGEQEED